jgi:hypothetical protein
MHNREHHQQAAELHDKAAHAHLAAAAANDKQDHLTGAELTRTALEHSKAAFDKSSDLQAAIFNRRPIAMFSKDEIASYAHKLWVERGSPYGSQDQDWQEATRQLRASAESNL